MIDLSDLNFSYPGSEESILNGVSLSVSEGEVYGLLGPSGAGKSTTQKILMGLLKGFTGKAMIFDKGVGEMGRNLYERIGVSFELPALYLRLTALENLELFAALYERPTRPPREVLALVDLEEDADKRVNTFSKGMKMRLNLCRALLHDPDLLFLDEPTTGQDPARARITRKLIQKLKSEGKTIFLTTHNMAEAAEICDRVAFLAKGKIAEEGSPEELKLRYGQRLLEVTHHEEGQLKRSQFPMENIGKNSDFSALLKQDRVVSLHTLEASLDDVFIRATAEARESSY